MLELERRAALIALLILISTIPEEAELCISWFFRESAGASQQEPLKNNVLLGLWPALLQVRHLWSSRASLTQRAILIL